MGYDINKLKSLNEFDVDNALRSYAKREDYDKALTEFVGKARSYLRMYNPTLVVYSNEIRTDFMAELDEVRRTLERVGVRLGERELENIDEAARTGNEKVLSDGLIKFFAKMEIIAGNIDGAKLKEAAGLPLIMAVDDMPEILTTITGMLQDRYRVIPLTSGAAALKALDVNLPSLFLLDIEMPDMGGFELAAEIRRKEMHSRTPIMFLTGQRLREYVLTAKALGIEDYILKPVNKEFLTGKIERALMAGKE